MRSRFAARAGRLTAVASSRCRLRFSRLEHANSFEAGDWLAGWSRADSNIGPDSVTNAVYLYAASGCTTNVLERYVDGTERNVSYTWTDDYRLASVSVDGEPAAEYAYDVLGNLVAVANDEESFEILVDNGHSLAGVAADGRTLRVYMRAPGVDNWLGFVDMTGNLPVPYFYVTDHLGSVLAVTDANGNVVERYEYDAWGKVLSVTDANGNALTRSAIGNRILWQAREYSWTTGLYYFRNRWYDPVIGRWISKDPIGIDGGVNLYEFCGGNPIIYADAFGLSFWGATKQFANDFAGGFLEGDFREESNAASVAGQIVGGCIPIWGQISDARDTAASARNVWKNPQCREAWKDFGASLAGWIPGLGDMVKGGRKLSKAAKKGFRRAKGAVDAASERTAREMANQIERDLGRSARRQFHDAKQGRGDRSKSQLSDDAAALYEAAGVKMPGWMHF